MSRETHKDFKEDTVSIDNNKNFQENNVSCENIKDFQEDAASLIKGRLPPCSGKAAFKVNGKRTYENENHRLAKIMCDNVKSTWKILR